MAKLNFMNFRNILFYSGLIILIVISFLLYSLRFYPQLNSDDALNVLMTYYYKLPNDFYCWGQDRGGTLIPLMSHFLHKILGFSPVISVSISNYIVLIIGYIGYSSLFKYKSSKIIFAVLWFLPAFRFIYLLRYPIGVQYSLIGFAIYLSQKIDFTTKNLMTNYLLLFSIILLFICSVWVSDLALFTISIFLSTFYIFHIIYKKTFLPRKDILIGGITGAALLYIFIRFAKSFTTSVNTSYFRINNTTEFTNGIFYLFKVLYNLLTFQTEEILFSIFYWLTILLLTFIILLFIKNKIKLPKYKKPYLYFFLFDVIIMTGIILFSKWVLLNGFDRRYFIGVYISFIIIVIMILEDSELSINYRRILYSYVTITAFIGSLSTVYVLKYINPKSLRSEISVRSEFLEFGQVGIIANYWHSYVSACPDPSKIKATPDDAGCVRNQKIVDEVFSQPNLFIIKNSWFDNFPDTLEQFGYQLLRDGDSFKLANCEVNKYIKIKRNKTISFTSFKFNPGILIQDNKIIIQKDSACLKNTYVARGPFFPIGIGNFSVKYKISFKNYINNQAIAMFDIAADDGKIILAKKELINEFNNSDFGDFELSFRTDKRYKRIEFRIFYYGNTDFFIENIQLIEK